MDPSSFGMPETIIVVVATLFVTILIAVGAFAYWQRKANRLRAYRTDAERSVASSDPLLHVPGQSIKVSILKVSCSRLNY